MLGLAVDKRYVLSNLLMTLSQIFVSFFLKKTLVRGLHTGCRNTDEGTMLRQ